jgi:hypothetical protein
MIRGVREPRFDCVCVSIYSVFQNLCVCVAVLSWRHLYCWPQNGVPLIIGIKLQFRFAVVIRWRTRIEYMSVVWIVICFVVIELYHRIEISRYRNIVHYIGFY